MKTESGVRALLYILSHQLAEAALDHVRSPAAVYFIFLMVGWIIQLHSILHENWLQPQRLANLIWFFIFA